VFSFCCAPKQTGISAAQVGGGNTVAGAFLSGALDDKGYQGCVKRAGKRGGVRAVVCALVCSGC